MPVNQAAEIAASQLSNQRRLQEVNMIVIAAVTAAIAFVVGRYAGRRGLIIASLVVLAGSAIVLASRYDGFSYVIFVILNVAIFEIVAVFTMLVLPAPLLPTPAPSVRASGLAVEGEPAVSSHASKSSANARNAPPA
jgi:hypothetical protein